MIASTNMKNSKDIVANNRIAGISPIETRLAKSSLFLALIVTGLSAGFFYAWQVSSIPGFRVIDDITYIQTMNGVNANVRNPGFGIIFFGSIVLMLFALIVRAKQWQTASFGFLTMAFIFYLCGLLLITFVIHVPMNRELLTYTDLSNVDVATIRQNYESRWNAWHLVRTIAGICSFSCLLTAVFIEKRLK